MDVLSRVLEPIRARGSVFCHGPVRAPWRFAGGAPGRCLFHCVLEGSAWVLRAASAPVRVGAGDVVLLPRGGNHQMGSAARGRPVPLRDAVSAASVDQPFARFEIGGEGPATHLICGSFELDGMDWHPLLRELPDLIVVNASVGRWLSPTLSSLERYLDGDEPGAELITQRLCEVLLVQTLATWLGSGELPAGWLRALGDARIGRAIASMHSAPAHDWTVDELARRAGMSRSAFFAEFKALVGDSPARYLQQWRLTLAARALEREDAAVAEICERVGYASVPSFTHAFRRQHGMTPAAFRRAHRPTPLAEAS